MQDRTIDIINVDKGIRQGVSLNPLLERIIEKIFEEGNTVQDRYILGQKPVKMVTLADEVLLMGGGIATE